MKSLLIAASLVSLAFACDDGNQDVESVSPPPIPATDVDYIDNLAPHHQMAVRMAEIEIAQGTRPEVRAMAEEMRAAQLEEIAMLREIRARLGEGSEIALLRDPHVEADIEALSAAAGAEVDRLFLQNMIPHHAGAVSLSHRALDNLSEADLRAIAETTIIVQTREMNEMLDMLGL